MLAIVLQVGRKLCAVEEDNDQMVKLDAEKTHQRLLVDRPKWPLGPIFLRNALHHQQLNLSISKPRCESSLRSSGVAIYPYLAEVILEYEIVQDEAGVVYIVRLVSLRNEVVAHACTAMLCPQPSR